MSLQHYDVFGLRVASELPLADLRPASGERATDVAIRWGDVAPPETPPTGLIVEGDLALLCIEGIARYAIRGGREIVVEADPAASERNLRLFLLGSAFAAILHQRSLLPLHANAIVVEGKAIAFLGHPGAGKSTMAAWFHDRGFPVLADDVCVVTLDQAGRPIAHPGLPRLRLWREALEASGRVADDYELSFDAMDKYDVPARTSDISGGVPLDHLYILEKAEGPDGAAVERLRGARAVEALVANTYRGAYVPLMGLTQRHLLACAAVAGKVPVFRASRLWGLDRIDAQAGLLEQHARATILRTTA